MATTKPVSFPSKRLDVEITSTDLSFKLDNIVGWDGVNDITSASYGTVHYITFRNDTNTRVEFMQIDTSTIANYATTGIVINLRGLAYDGTSLVESSARKFTWPKNETIVELGTHAPHLLADFVSLGRDHTITGALTFNGTTTFSESAMPRISAAHTYGVGEEEFLVTKRYADSLTFSGAPNASTTQKGIVEEATLAETLAGTATGGTGAKLYVSPDILQQILQGAVSTYVVEDGTGSDDTYTGTATPTPTGFTTGMIFRVKFTVANTTAATFNPNGLGAKAIKKYVSGAKADIETGDIVANYVGIIEYDGTDFILLSMTATMPTTALLSEMATFFASTDLTPTEAETLSSGVTSNADLLHTHGIQNVLALSGFCHRHIDEDTTYTQTLNGGTLTPTGPTLVYGFIASSATANGATATVSMAADANSPLTWANAVTMTFAIQGAGGDISASDAFIGMGALTDTGNIQENNALTLRHVAVLIQDGTAFASVADGTTQGTPVSLGSIATGKNITIVWTPASSAKFYVNGVLTATFTTNLPSGSTDFGAFRVGIEGDATTKILFYSDVDIWYKP